MSVAHGAPSLLVKQHVGTYAQQGAEATEAWVPTSLGQEPRSLAVVRFIDYRR